MKRRLRNVPFAIVVIIFGWSAITNTADMIHDHGFWYALGHWLQALGLLLIAFGSMGVAIIGYEWLRRDIRRGLRKREERKAAERKRREGELTVTHRGG